MLITLHMFSLSVVCTLNTQLKLLPFKRYTVLRRTVNGNFILTPTVNSGELRILYPVPYPVPVCVTGNLWLVKFNGFILQLMAKTNHKFPDHANRNY